MTTITQLTQEFTFQREQYAPAKFAVTISYPEPEDMNRAIAVADNAAAIFVCEAKRTQEIRATLFSRLAKFHVTPGEAIDALATLGIPAPVTARDYNEALRLVSNLSYPEDMPPAWKWWADGVYLKQAPAPETAEGEGL